HRGPIKAGCASPLPGSIVGYYRYSVVGERTLAFPAFRIVPRRSRSKIEGVSLPVTLPLIDHLALRVRDVRRSRIFYERALEPFGVKVVESSQGAGFAIEGGGDSWIGE